MTYLQTGGGGRPLSELSGPTSDERGFCLKNMDRVGHVPPRVSQGDK